MQYVNIFFFICRKNLSLQPVDKEEDAHLFTYRDLNRTHVSVVLAQSVDTLVDSDSPQNVVKFRLGCDFDTGDDLVRTTFPNPAGLGWVSTSLDHLTFKLLLSKLCVGL